MARHHYETLQQVFDDAYRGLAAQGFVQSIDDDGSCVYRSSDGFRCAVGHCIPDRLYNDTLEGFRPTSDLPVFVEIFGSFDLRQQAAELQSCHDSAEGPDDVKERLTAYAGKYGLTIPSIGEAA